MPLVDTGMASVGGCLARRIGIFARFLVTGGLALGVAGSSVASGSAGVAEPSGDAAIAPLESRRQVRLVARSDALPSHPRDADLSAYRVVDGGLAWKWRAVNDAIRAENGIIAQCRLDLQQCPPHVARFVAIIDSARMRTGRARLGEINRAINLAIQPLSDETRHGVEDVWSAPLSTFAAGAGDCEDYAIAKYVALRHAGMAAADLRLSVVRDTARNIDHAVLSARLDEQWLVLDNRTFLLVEEGAIPNYVILFALDDRGIVGYSRHAPASATLPIKETTSIR